MAHNYLLKVLYKARMSCAHAQMVAQNERKGMALHRFLGHQKDSASEVLLIIFIGCCNVTSYNNMSC